MALTAFPQIADKVDHQTQRHHIILASPSSLHLHLFPLLLLLLLCLLEQEGLLGLLRLLLVHVGRRELEEVGADHACGTRVEVDGRVRHPGELGVGRAGDGADVENAALRAHQPSASA